MKLYLNVRHYRHTVYGFGWYQHYLRGGVVPNLITVGIDGRGLAIHPRLTARSAFRFAQEAASEEFYVPFEPGLEVSPVGGKTVVTLRIVQDTGIVKEHRAESVCSIEDHYNKHSGVMVALVRLFKDKLFLVELVKLMGADPDAQRIQNYVPWLFREEDAEPISNHLERRKTAHRGPQTALTGD